VDPQEGKGNEQDEVFPLGRELALACSRGFFLVLLSGFVLTPDHARTVFLPRHLRSRGGACAAKGRKLFKLGEVGFSRCLALRVRDTHIGSAPLLDLRWCRRGLYSFLGF
jgi:hypothetical protein